MKTSCIHSYIHSFFLALDGGYDVTSCFKACALSFPKAEVVSQINPFFLKQNFVWVVLSQ